MKLKIIKFMLAVAMLSAYTIQNNLPCISAAGSNADSTLAEEDYLYTYIIQKISDRILIRKTTKVGPFLINDEIIFSDTISLSGFPVLVVGSDTFVGCETLKNVSLSDSAYLTVGGAFENCKALESVTFSEIKKLSIQPFAFAGCTSLKQLDFSDIREPIDIRGGAFENTAIDHLQFNYPCTIDSQAFANCPNLEKAVFMKDADIAAGAFKKCPSLKTVEFNGNINLGPKVFQDCDLLENINIDTSLNPQIDGRAFNYCTDLTTINSIPVIDETGEIVPKYKEFIYSSFNAVEEVGFINQYVKAQVKKIVRENTTDDMTDMEKLRSLHDWVCAHTVYDVGNENDPKNHTDASILLNGVSVCEGYARMCNLLYNEAGIESCYVSSPDHAWNIVRINGNYFHTDATWDDGDEISRNWFLKSDAELKAEGGSHSKWSLNMPSSLHSFQSDFLPECSFSMGDINKDGNVSIADAVLLQKYILGNSTLDESNFILADLSYDGTIDIFDLVALKKKILLK